jgi:hypothetical protein
MRRSCSSTGSVSRIAMNSPPNSLTVFLATSGKSGATVPSGAKVKIIGCPASAASRNMVSQNISRRRMNRSFPNGKTETMASTIK